MQGIGSGSPACSAFFDGLFRTFERVKELGAQRIKVSEAHFESLNVVAAD